MDISYFELKAIIDSVYAGIEVDCAKQVIKLLEKYNIKLRTKDGGLYSVNIFIPKSRENCILVGLRYTKSDNSYTEDHFLFEINKPIELFYKGKLEQVLKEYKGSHKQQVL